jgi:uncharacterized protein YabE (DUF348 family)
MSSDPPSPVVSTASTQPLPAVRSGWRAYLPVISLGVVVIGILLVVVAALVASLIRVTPVTVVLDGEAFQRDTRAATVADLLADLDLHLDPRDFVSLPLNTPIEDGLVLHINRARVVSLTVDGQTRQLWTPLTNPAEILENAAVQVGEQDVIHLDGTAADLEDLDHWPVPITRLSVRHAVTLRVDDNGEERLIQTTGETVGDALFEAGIPIYLADEVSVELNTPVSPNLEVAIRRAKSISITADNVTIQTRTQGETIADALADAGIALMGLDYTIPGEDEPLEDHADVRVVRVKEEVITETQSIDFETVRQANDNLEIDQSSVVQEGQPGIQQIITRIRYEDGVEVSRTTGEATVLRPPVNRVVIYGTNVVVRTVDTPEGPRPYWRVLRLYATSYHPEALGGDSTTATGRTLQHGIVAADTSVLPFGTEVYVPGYGFGVVQDTAPPRRNGMWIDLGYSDADYRHWSRYVDVYVLGEAP